MTSPTSPKRLTWRNVAAFRLRRQHLDSRAPAESAAQVVGDLCGLHAQLLSSAELMLWARVQGLASGGLAEALWEKRTLVKTWAMRGTLHVLPGAEYPLWQAGLGTYDHYLKNAWFKYFGVSREELEELIHALERCLYGAALTREELTGRVEELTGNSQLAEKLSDGWGALLKPASFRGVLCFAPNAGSKVRFTHPQSWLGPQESIDGETAIGAITRRFLAANGPATREDYARWWAVSPAKALSRIKALGDEVAEVEVDGERMWMLAGDVDAAVAPPPEGILNLLPAFDQYVIAATKHAPHLIDGNNRARIYRPQGWVSPVLLVDGRMAGIWSHEAKGHRLKVQVQPFDQLPGWARSAVGTEAHSLAGFLGCTDLELSW